MKKRKKGKFQLDFQRLFFCHFYLCYIGKIVVAKLCNEFLRTFFDTFLCGNCCSS